MYIEPCCIDRQLPRLLRGGGRFFQTSGDITVQKMLSAVSWLCGRSLRLTLVAPEVDASLLRVLAHYFSQGWLVQLRLLTRACQEPLVTSSLLPLPVGQSVEYITDPLTVDGLMCVEGDERTCIIQGAMLTGGPDFGFSLYSAYLGTDAETIASAMDAVNAKFRIRTSKCKHTVSTP